jgi:hypothetical protein
LRASFPQTIKTVIIINILMVLLQKKITNPVIPLSHIGVTLKGMLTKFSYAPGKESMTADAAMVVFLSDFNLQFDSSFYLKRTIFLVWMVPFTSNLYKYMPLATDLPSSVFPYQGIW